MKKKLIDKVITKNYSYLVSYTNAHIKKYNHTRYEAEEIISLCYSYLLDFEFIELDEENIIKMTQYWIKKQLCWNTSPINYKKKKGVNINYNVDLSIYEVASYDSFLDISLIEELSDNYFEGKTSYTKQLWNMYYNKGIDTAVKMAEYLDMSRTTGYNTIRECKVIEQDFKNYVIKEIKNR